MSLHHLMFPKLPEHQNQWEHLINPYYHTQTTELSLLILLENIISLTEILKRSQLIHPKIL